MTAPGPALVRSELPDVPGDGARVRVEPVEPVRRGSARPLDPDRPTAPVRPHPSSPGLPVPDAGSRVVGAAPAGLGGGFPRPDGDAVGRPQALAPASPSRFRTWGAA